MDATPYEWVTGEIWYLHLAIDDASGVVTSAWFDTQETLNGCYHVFLISFLPIKELYLLTRKKVPYLRTKTPIHSSYACKQLGTQLKSGSVPQVKGRIERLNQTLQSRLPTKV